MGQISPVGLLPFTGTYSPFDDPHVSAGEMVDYLDQLRKPLIKPFLMLSLTKPDTGINIILKGQSIGQVNCISIARSGEPIALRYYGQNATGTASGQARLTQAKAAQDVADLADSKQVAYPKQAELVTNYRRCAPSG
jgi:hypothetical protein